jgi:hypothetical protein
LLQKKVQTEHEGLLKKKNHVPNTIQGSSIKKDTTASLVGTVEMHNVTANHYQSKWIPPSIVICP